MTTTFPDGRRVNDHPYRRCESRHWCARVGANLQCGGQARKWLGGKRVCVKCWREKA